MTIDWNNIDFDTAPKAGGIYDHGEGQGYSYSFHMGSEGAQKLHAFMQEKGYNGGGPSFIDIIINLIQIHDKEMLTEVDFDDASDGATVFANRRKPLEKVAILMGKALEDRDFLLQAIDTGAATNPFAFL